MISKLHYFCQGKINFGGTHENTSVLGVFICIISSLRFAIVTIHVLKQIFAVPRPDTYWLVNATGYGHPSGHIMYDTAFVGICVYLFFQHSNKAVLKRFVALSFERLSHTYKNMLYFLISVIHNSYNYFSCSI